LTIDRPINNMNGILWPY